MLSNILNSLPPLRVSIISVALQFLIDRPICICHCLFKAASIKLEVTMHSLGLEKNSIFLRYSTRWLRSLSNVPHHLLHTQRQKFLASCMEAVLDDGSVVTK